MLDRRTLDSINSTIKMIDNLQTELDLVMSSDIRLAHIDEYDNVRKYVSQNAERLMKTAAKAALETEIQTLKGTLKDKFNVKV